MNQLWQRRASLRKYLRGLTMAMAGVAILYHEVWVADTAEPLLVFLGLWFVGIPPAMFFDGLRKVGEQAKSEMEEALTGDTKDVPKPIEPPDATP